MTTGLIGFAVMLSGIAVFCFIRAIEWMLGRKVSRKAASVLFLGGYLVLMGALFVDLVTGK